MLKNYFKIALRSLWRNKGFSAINIIGLAVGMAAVMLILLWIQDELSYDEFHENKHRIYEVWNRKTGGGEVSCSNSVSAPTAEAIEKDLPEVERAVRAVRANSLLTVGDKKIIRSGNIVDSGFLQVFTFPILKGNPSTALNGAYSVVITERTARSLFGNKDAMGQIIKFDDEKNFTVTGILKDLPNNSRFEFDYLLPWSSL